LRYELRIGGGTSGNSSGGEFDGYAGAGYEFRSGGLAFGPIASLEYTDVGVSEYQEQGSLAPLRILSQDQDSLRTNLGLGASYSWEIDKIQLKPSLRAG
jgi:outer membrane autotransporter protein